MRSVTRSRRRFWATFFVLATAACAPHGVPVETAFGLELNECEQSLDACKSRCAPPTSDPPTCDALLVVQVEDFVRTHRMPLPDGEEQVEGSLQRICKKGIRRACAADQLLAADIKRVAELRESENVEVRARELEREAIAIASLSSPGFTTCGDGAHAQTPTVHAACNAKELAGVARRCMSGCDTCSPGCKEELRNAETAFAAAQKLSMDETGAAQATKAVADEKGAKERVVTDALSAALQAQEDACLSDLPACKRSCSTAPSSMACGFLATAYATGKGDVAVDVKEATRLARGGCAASASPNKLACSAQKYLEADAKNCSGEACKPYCGEAKCGYPPGGRVCLYGDACAKVGNDLLTASKDNADQAAPLFEKGCAANSGLACEGLSALYSAGTSVPKDAKKAESILKKACDLYTAEMRSDIARVADPVAFGAMQNACRSYEGLVCVNKVQAPSRRRSAKDVVCTGATPSLAAWATLNGTDVDGCASAMTSRGCEEVAGQGVYCCPP